MRALLKKDFLLMRSNLAVYVVSALIFAVVFFTTYGEMAVGPMIQSLYTVALVTLPINVISSDEKSGWEVYSMTLPVSRRAVVLSRYALVGVSAFVFAIVNLLLTAGSAVLLGEGLTLDMLFRSMSSPCVGVIIADFVLPVLIYFGSEKGRYLFVIVCFFFMFFPLWLVWGSDVNGYAINEGVVQAVVVLSTVLLTVVSVLLSMVFYAHKEIC